MAKNQYLLRGQGSCNIFLKLALAEVLEVGSWVFISIIELSVRPQPTHWKMTQSSVFGSLCFLPSLKQDRFCYILTLHTCPTLPCLCSWVHESWPFKNRRLRNSKRIFWCKVRKFGQILTFGCSPRFLLTQKYVFGVFVHFVLYMDVSLNDGTPKSSTLIGFSIINHPFWGTPIFGNTHIVFFKTLSEFPHLFSRTETSV